MGFLSKIFGKNETVETVGGMQDYMTLIRVYFQAAIAAQVGITNIGMLPDLRVFKTTFKVPTEHNKLGVGEKSRCRKMLKEMYGHDDAFFKEIDKINILQATFLAMRRAVDGLDVKPDLALIDGNQKPGLDIDEVTIVKGDAKCSSVAAASILAKVTRDRLMVEYDSIMPEYGFASNKGYGSAEHIAAIRKYGPSPIHRASFIKNFI